jgi:uncharacterized protein (TIGR02246 family)
LFRESIWRCREEVVVKKLGLFVALCLVSVPAFADPTSDAKAHSEAFEHAANARDTKAVMALYADGARAIWPGQGEEATGKAEIEKMVSKFVAELPKDAKIMLQSQTAIPLGSDYIATVGHWEETFTDPDGKHQNVSLRTTEIIKKQGGKTLYVVDHASVGLPPSEPTATH